MLGGGVKIFPFYALSLSRVCFDSLDSTPPIPYRRLRKWSPFVTVPTGLSEFLDVICSMVSIRRTLSPYGGRMYQKGSDSPASLQAAPQKLFSHSRSTFSPIRRFIAGLLPLVHFPRKGNRLKRSLFSCMMFFFLGIILGMAPLEGDFMTDLRNRDLVNAGFHAAVPVNVSGLIVAGEVGAAKELVDSVTLEASTISFRNGRKRILDSSSTGKPLIVVTPTYSRGLQAYYLNRLGQVLKLLKPPVLWMVVETKVASLETADILRNLGVVYRHLVSKRTNENVKDRGVHQRNTALEHIEKHKLDGIVYFADDDNVYTIDLFESIRNISCFGTWPVGMMAQSKNKAILEGPVCSGDQVIGWHTNEKSKRLRRFHVDMSGFAFNSTILWDPKRRRRHPSDPIRQLDTVKEGFQETTFIEQIVEDESHMEAIPPGCNRIMNWHLHLDAGEIIYPSGWMLRENLDAT